jgi:hypothetical protein
LLASVDLPVGYRISELPLNLDQMPPVLLV